MWLAITTTELRVAIVGGGIGGVTAALALRARGIDVRVYEQAAALTEVGAGLTLQPNGVRMLRRLGFGADVERLGARWIDPQFRHPDGTLIAPMWPSGAASAIEMYGSAPRRPGRSTACSSLDCLRAVKTDHRCIGFEQDANQAFLSFANGERVSADVGRGADGIHSTLQRS